jgi:hypothetical protein
MKSKKIRYVLCLLVTALLFFLLYNGTWIFESFVARYFCEAVLLIIIFFLALNVSIVKLFPLRLVLLMVFVPLLIFGLAWMYFETYKLYEYFKSGGINSSFEKVATLDYQNQKISAYRSNGGAATSFGIIVRSEKQVLPGIIKVRTLYDRYRCMFVDLAIKSDSLVIVPDNNESLKEIVVLK